MGRTEPREESPLDSKLSENFLVPILSTTTPNSKKCPDFAPTISGALSWQS